MDPNDTKTPTPGTQPDDQSAYGAGQFNQPDASSQPGAVSTPGAPTSPVVPQVQPGQSPVTPTQPFNTMFQGQPPTGSSFSSSPQGSMNNGGFKNKKLVMIVILIVAVIVLVVGGYFGYNALKKQNQKDTVSNAVSQSTAKAKASGATDISTLTSLTFNIPDSAVSGLTAGQSTNPNAKLWKASDGNCIMLYGTGNSSFLPGSSVTDITNAYLDNLRKLPNAVVNGPTTADPRIIPDASDASKKYSIPSLTFSVTQNKSETKGYYSAALLKNGDRVIVETACNNSSGAVDQSRMDAMNAVAKQLTLTVQ